MVKFRKFFIGTAIDVVAGLVGVILWVLQQTSVKMPKGDRPIVTLVIVGIMIPGIITYFLWYKSTVKAHANVGMSEPKFIVFFCIGLALAAAIALIPGLFVVPKAIKYIIIALVVSQIGALAGYFVGKPD